jgi:hypothetical protein
MALLNPSSFERIQKSRNTVHKPVSATYSFFEENGLKLFQIDTYGTAERAMPEKVSQSIQLDKQMAKIIIEILKKEFYLD